MSALKDSIMAGIEASQQEAVAQGWKDRLANMPPPVRPILDQAAVYGLTQVIDADLVMELLTRGYVVMKRPEDGDLVKAVKS